MTYKIVGARTGQFLMDAVNALIREGWEPLGGVAVTCEGDLLQALIKRT
jgi:hypothetical protein